MQMKPFATDPIALTTTYTTNLLNPGTTTGGVNCTSAPFDKLMILLTKIRVTNVDGTNSASFRLFKGATGANAAGTQIAYDVPVAAGSYVDMYMRKPLFSDEFIVGGASANSDLVIEFEGEIGVA